MKTYELLAMKLLKDGIISASADGRIWKHYDGRNNVKHWLEIPREIKPRLRKGGDYYHISLDSRAIRVHRLMWIAFFGEIPDGLEINHKNGNKLDNRIDNLELATRQENALHAHRTGLVKNKAIGSRASRSKLTENDVREIRRLHFDHKVSISTLSKMFKIATRNIIKAFNGETWKHVK